MSGTQRPQVPPEASASVPKRCESRRRDGSACASLALAGRRWCFSHDPDRAEERDEARRKGGRNSSSAARLRVLVPPRLASVHDRLETALAQVHEGDLDPKIASAMGSLARALVAVLTSGELEQRVRDLEATKGGPP